MAKVKKTDEQVAEKAGRALIDLPAHDLAAGEYASLPSEIADALASIGSFDLNAVEVKE